MSIASNGWVFYIGRGDCRTDAARGALLGLNALGRMLNHADPNVGLGCGTVHIWDPEAATGAVNSGVTLAGTLAVYGDGGQGGERTSDGDHKMEWGLLGVAVAPDFEQTGHIYLQYFPSYNPNSKPAGLPTSPTGSARCPSRGSRASRSTARRRSSTSTPRYGSSSTTPRSLAAATSAAAWASTRRATST